MKFIVGTILISLLAANISFGQEKEITIGVVSRNVDSTFTHLYVSLARSMNKQNPHQFNILDFYMEKLKLEFPDSEFEIKSIAWQSSFNKFNFYNLNRKPTGKCRQWMKALHEEEGIDCLIFLDGDESFNIGNPSNSYGIATYYNDLRLMTIYFMIEPSIYFTNPPSKVRMDFADRYHLERPVKMKEGQRLTINEAEQIPEKYYNMALDSIKYYADKQVKMISKFLHQEIKNPKRK